MSPDSSAMADDQLDDAQRRFIEEFALLLTEAGMTRMPARVFACLVADDGGELTAGELAQRLGVSPAAISGAVRYLTQVGLLVRGRAPGARRDHYRLGEGLWYEALTERDTLLARWQEAMDEGARLLGVDRPAGRRMRESSEFFAFMRVELRGMMERWRAHKQAGE